MIRCQHLFPAALLCALLGAGAARAGTLPARLERGGESLSGTIAFVSERSGDDEIWLLDLPSGRSTRLTVNPAGPDRAPAWSPDGAWLAFNSRRDPHPEQPDIYIAKPGRGAARRVTNDPQEEQRAAWLGDGSGLVFQRGDFAAGFEIWRVNLETGREKRLTRTRDGSIDAAPDPSPVSRLLVLQSNRGSEEIFPFHLAIREPGRMRPRTIDVDVADSVDGPRWSPDGRRIAFAAGGDLYVIDFGTEKLTRVTNGPDYDLSPDWSPDGTALVFQSDRKVGAGGLHVLTLSTGKIVYLGEGRTPVWTAARHR